MKGIFLFGIFFGTFAWSQPAYVPGEILVKFRPGTGAISSLIRGDTASERISDIDVTIVKIRPGTSIFKAIVDYRKNPNVLWAEPNYVASAADVPNDPDYSIQWGLSTINCPSAWSLTKGNSGVIIAIIDSGVDLQHPEFSGKLIPGWDFVNKDAIPDDDNGHGTHCAGIAAASTDNGIGVAGVGWNSAIMPVKVLDAKGNGSYTNIANGILYAAKNGAKVISLSLGGKNSSNTLLSAINTAWAQGCVVVCAAGNDGTSAAFYPAFYANAISVGAVDRLDQKTWYSNFGTWVDVAAPGDDVFSTLPGGTYGYKYGTSMSAPFVAGQAALLYAQLGQFCPPSYIRNRIESTAVPIGNWLVRGRINVGASLLSDSQETPSDQRYEFGPTNYWVSKGMRTTGALKELQLSDDRRLEISPPRSGTSRDMEWTAQTFCSFPGTPTRIAVTIESNLSLSGLATAEMLNVQTNEWESAGSVSLTQSDTTNTFIFDDNCSKFFAPNGTLTVRFRATNLTKSTQIRLRTDAIRFVVTAH